MEVLFHDQWRRDQKNPNASRAKKFENNRPIVRVLEFSAARQLILDNAIDCSSDESK